MYLCAYAQGRGATGLTFFDDDVTEFFSPHAKKQELPLRRGPGSARLQNGPDTLEQGPLAGPSGSPASLRPR